MRLMAAAGAAVVVTTVLAPVAAATTNGTRAVAVHHHRTPKVLRVGTYDGKRGQFHTIQAAVDAAKPGDWILVGPGDYKTRKVKAAKDDAESPAGVLVTTPHVFIRGMDRNKVLVDGTKSGPPCSTAKRDQNFGPK